jgi:hypothetical protein
MKIFPSLGVLLQVYELFCFICIYNYLHQHNSIMFNSSIISTEVFKKHQNHNSLTLGGQVTILFCLPIVFNKFVNLKPKKLLIISISICSSLKEVPQSDQGLGRKSGLVVSKLNSRSKGCGFKSRPKY